MEASSTEESAAAPTTPAVAPANAAAIEALAATLAHVSPLAEGSGLLWVDASTANPPLEEQQLLDLLRPLAPNIAELTLSNCKVTDAFAELAAQMPNLRRLNLTQTAVSDLTVAALAGHPALSEIVLTRTAVTDASGPSLLAMPALERVYLWNSLYTPEAIEQLRTQRPELVADAGEFAESAIVAVELEPKFVDAGPTAAAPAKLTAVNTMCPVSGTAVDARYLVVHEGKVIGFCCTECPKQFWADPAKYLEKVKP